MRKSLRVFQRDVRRIARTPKTWVIVLGVLITPALYAWFNINAFWDPYASTHNIHVAIANLDTGVESDVTGPVDVGAQVVDQLRDNDQLGWQFMSEDDARAAVRGGKVYAAIVIPADFSKNLLSFTTGSFTQPTLTYYVNEKSSAIAPKITDVGAAGIDGQITRAFIEQVAHAATEALRDAGVELDANIMGAREKTVNAFDQTTRTIASARGDLSELQAGLQRSRGGVSDAKSILSGTITVLADVQTAIDQAQKLAVQAQRDALAFTDAATSAYVQGATLLADAAAEANTAATRAIQALGQAGSRLDTAINDIDAVITANAASLAQLQALVDSGTLPPDVSAQLTSVIHELQDKNAADQELLDELTALRESSDAVLAAIQGSSDALAVATRDAQNTAKGLRDVLTQTIPQINSAMSNLSSGAGAFSAALSAQQTQLGEAQNLLDAIDTQLVATASAIEALSSNLAGVEQSLTQARTDILALSSASALSNLHTVTGLDPEQIATFVAAPVEVDTHVVFPVANYGSAMAALFTNLSLWIGAFVLMVIFKVEVDTEGVEPISVREAYVGRFLLFATIAIGQAVIVCVGNLIIGIQTASALAFVGTGMLIAFAYVSIVYALSVSFGHVGRGISILLVIMQIPGASGLYPIELMPAFFRNIYPFLPFTYGIDAMRETIAGFYDGHWWILMGKLGVFVVLAWVLGLVLRRRLANLNLVFNREIAATDLLIGEDVQVVGSGYRLTDIIHTLAHRDEYRDELSRRFRPFTAHYTTLLRITFLVGIAGAAIIGLIAWLAHGQSATLLFVWVVWMLIIIGFLVVVEYLNQSFHLAQEVTALDDAHLRQAMLAHGPQRRPASDTRLQDTQEGAGA